MKMSKATKRDGNMTISKAIKNGYAVEVESDVYLLEDDRVLIYDRFYKGTRAAWLDDTGEVYRNFHEAFYR